MALTAPASAPMSHGAASVNCPSRSPSSAPTTTPTPMWVKTCNAARPSRRAGYFFPKSRRPSARTGSWRSIARSFNGMMPLSVM